MEDKNKDGTLASSAKGTASSPTKNNTTNALIYHGNDLSKMQYAAGLEVIYEATKGGTVDIHDTSLSDLSEAVLNRTLGYVSKVNCGRDKGEKMRLPNTISAVQAGELVFAYERIRMVCSAETIEDEKSEGTVAMYVDHGKDEGIYKEIGDGQIESWCSEIVGSVGSSWKREFTVKIHDMASRRENRVTECQDADLVWMANGIWNCSAGKMMGFDPELVALRKSTTVLPDKEPSEPVHVKPDGTPITFGQWIDSLVPYEGGRELLVKLAGATLRNRVNWRCMVTLYNKTGHNGKSTFLDHLKALVGNQGYMTSNLKTLAEARFGVSNIVGKILITCEDSDSGSYIKDVSRLKSIISQDTISVERKYEAMFDYQPHALVVAAANDIAATKEKSQAWTDRNIYVPFTGQFIGQTDDKTIRSEWVVSDEFCSYMAYQALVKMPYYESLPEPDEALQLKGEWLKDNDSIVEFFEDYLCSLGLDFIPLDFAWMSYQGWLANNRPSTPMKNSREFNKHLIDVAESSGEWVRPMSGKDARYLPCKKWIPDAMRFKDARFLSGRKRGIVRKPMWDYFEQTGQTPFDLGDKLPSVRASLGISSGGDFSSEED